MKALLAMTTALVLAMPAGATSLINKDSERYDIAVNSGGGTMRTTINGKTTKSGVCPSSASSCKIEVEGVGEIEVSGSEDVIIEDGELEAD
ncbi:MAG: hypothetical protein AAFR46_11730 [Pseudomonadota bacterium]